MPDFMDRDATPLARFVTGGRSRRDVARHQVRGCFLLLASFIGFCLTIGIAIAFPPSLLVIAPLLVWLCVRMLRRPRPGDDRPE